MGNFHLMEIAKCLSNLPDNGPDGRIREWPMCFGKFREGCPAEIFHYDVHGLVVLEAIDYFDN